MVLAFLYDLKCQLCPLVLKSNVTEAQPLRLKIYSCFKRKFVSGDRRLYLHARHNALLSDVDRLLLTKQLLNPNCIVGLYVIFS